MGEVLDKTLPIPNADTQTFWKGCAQGQLLLQQCLDCGLYRHPPVNICPRCLSIRSGWVPASGRGKVFSFAIVHQALHAEWKNRVPYAIAIIELDEGPHILSNIVGVAHSAIKVDMPVVVTFEKVKEGVSLPEFKPL